MFLKRNGGTTIAISFTSSLRAGRTRVTEWTICPRRRRALLAFNDVKKAAVIANRAARACKAKVDHGISAALARNGVWLSLFSAARRHGTSA